MRLVIFGLTVSSSWGNGHATLWRGLWRALARRGHHIVFFERDVPYYAEHRDLAELPGGELVLYRDWSDALARARRELREADVAMVTSYCPDGIAATELLADAAPKAVKVFYDLDTPVTLENLQAGRPVSYLGPRGLRDFDLVLSYTGGRALEQLRTQLGARRVATLYGHVDPQVHRPVPPVENYRCALSYLGTYAADRQQALDTLFLEPARRLPEQGFLIGGAQYPAEFPWTANIRFVRHMPPPEHPAFFSSSRLTLSVTRRAMADNGYCPSGRLFEAAACAVPLVSDWWPGLDEFFEPGRELVVARTSEDVVAAMALGDAELTRIGAAAQQRVLAAHTSDRRAVELEALLEDARSGQAQAGDTPPAQRKSGLTWGIVPAAGLGTRIQPLGFSKELLPIASSVVGGVERPRAVSEFLLERMLNAGANRVCFVVAPGKSDIVQYYGSSARSADLCYVVQPKAGGLCDAIFRACSLIRPEDSVLVGLPDTIWFPDDGFARLPDDVLSFLLFPVDRPEAFDAVVTDENGNVQEIQVKHPDAKTNWIWGAFRMPGHVLHALDALWHERGRRDEYMGTLVNAYIQGGGRAIGVRHGEAYVDVGTVHGYREALNLLGTRHRPEAQEQAQSTTICSNAGTALAALAPPPTAPAGGARRSFTRADIEGRLRGLGDWFQNFDLNGVQTAPAHFLGDFPTIKWKRFAHALPHDLTGKSVLEIGCNAGFYSFEMKKRGAARVLGIDFDDYYLNQARFAGEVLGFEDVEFRRMSVYDLGALGERFDVVLFMGLFYHLRHPLLALDLIHEHVAKDLLVFQSLQRGSNEIEPVADDYDFWETEVFDRPGYPRMHFVEKKYSHDETNWWLPNAACSAAMLRSAGFQVIAHPEEEVFLCRRQELPAAPAGRRAVYPARQPD